MKKRRERKAKHQDQAARTRADRPSVDRPFSHLIPEGHTLGEIFSPTALWLIESELHEPDHDVTPKRVAAAIEANPDQLLPDATRKFVCEVLRRGKVKKPRGRSPASRSRQSAETTAAILYPILLKMMRKDSKERGVTHVQPGEVPMHQRVVLAAGRIAGLPNLTAERLANVISARKKLRNKRDSSR